MTIPYNKPFVTGKELDYIREAVAQGHVSGDGIFSRRVHAWLGRHLGSPALLTHSGTAALEMFGLLLDVKPGDEVIMPSFTFVSTANAFVLRGAVPVFVDIRPDTMNIDETLIEGAVTSKTRAIAAVHYAGVSCEMDAICAIGAAHGVPVVEDAAQGIGAAYKGRPLGTVGTLGALSFHETKNVISGEGGALIVNDAALMERAEIIREKGTNRSRFFRGQIDKYTWVDVGSSFLPSDIIAAFLWAQLENFDAISTERLAHWQRYNENLAGLEESGLIRRPIIPANAKHNGHIYYVLVQDGSRRDKILEALRERGAGAVFHYVPLHSSPGGRRFGRAHGSMKATDDCSARLIRLPLYHGIGEATIDRICEALTDVVTE